VSTDPQDLMEAYTYDIDGYLMSKAEGSDGTSYTYSSRGELLEVVLPGTTEIAYLRKPSGCVWRRWSTR